MTDDEKYQFQFRPLHPDSLQLLVDVHKAEGEDPVKAFSRLMTTSIMSSAILGMSFEQYCECAKAAYPQAERAISERKDIFGDVEGGPDLEPLGYNPPDREWIDLSVMGSAYEEQLDPKTDDRRYRPKTMGMEKPEKWIKGSSPK